MIEILFTESAAGSMKMAKGIKNIAGSSTAVLVINDDGTQPTAEELERERTKVEEEYRRKCENAIAVEGSSRDVVCFPLNLSMGGISEPFFDKRAEYLQSTVLIGGPNFAEIGAELMATARRSLARVQAAAEPVRIWTSRNPDEACGFCHILTCLPAEADIRVVELPQMEMVDGEIRAYTGWGEISPYDLGRFQELERPLTDDERRSYTALWRELQSENGPLRAVVNGRLVSVGSDFYDGIILREIKRQPERFHEGRLIGEILGRYQLGLGDSLIALRIEEFISRGMLIPATEPEEDRPIYHRFLLKGSCMNRFYDAHRRDFDTALAEIRRGSKQSHWMWYIFPQLKGLGRSSTAQYYGLDGLEEARRFAADPVLGGNLRTITQALLDQPRRNAHAVFGGTDAMKLRSCMTLFELADPDCALYAQVIGEFFGGSRDRKTLDMLK